MERTRSVMPPIAAAADTFAAPWFLADPTPRHDLPGRRRLPWPLGVAVAIAFARAFLRPRDAVAGLLLAHGAAVLLAVVAGGQADHPNGSRFAYLASLAAVAAAAGVLWLVGLFPPARRRAAALAAVGILAIARRARRARRADRLARASRDLRFLPRAGHRDRPRGLALGGLRSGHVEPGVGHSPLAFEAVRALPTRTGKRSDAEARRRARYAAGWCAPRRSRRGRPASASSSGSWIRWGREWARVLARRERPRVTFPFDARGLPRL